MGTKDIIIKKLKIKPLTLRRMRVEGFEVTAPQLAAVQLPKGRYQIIPLEKPEEDVILLSGLKVPIRPETREKKPKVPIRPETREKSTILPKGRVTGEQLIRILERKGVKFDENEKKLMKGMVYPREIVKVWLRELENQRAGRGYTVKRGRGDVMLV